MQDNYSKKIFSGRAMPIRITSVQISGVLMFTCVIHMGVGGESVRLDW